MPELPCRLPFLHYLQYLMQCGSYVNRVGCIVQGMTTRVCAYSGPSSFGEGGYRGLNRGALNP